MHIYIKIIAVQRTFEKGAMELKGRRLPGEEVALRLRVNGEEEVWLENWGCCELIKAHWVR